MMLLFITLGANPDSLWALGEWERQHGLFEEAISHYQALEMMGDPRGTLGRARLRAMRGDLAGARELYSSIADRLPLANFYWEYVPCLGEEAQEVADSLLARGDTTRALLAMAALPDTQGLSLALSYVSAHPRDSGSLLYAENLINSCLALGDSQRLAILGKALGALSGSPKLPKALSLWISTALALSDTQAALEKAQEFLAKRQGDPDLALALGAFVARGRLNIPGAESWLLWAVEGEPSPTPGLETGQERRLRAYLYWSLVTGKWRPEGVPAVIPENNSLGLRSLYHLALGRARLLAGDTLEAVKNLALSVHWGAPRNAWPEMALRTLKGLGIGQDSVASLLRGLLDYRGPTFRRVDLGVRAREVAWVDFDLDGDLDLLAGGKLLENRRGHLVDITDRVGIGPHPDAVGARAGDINGDGRPDILIFGKTEHVYVNQGRGFRELRGAIPDTLPTEDAALLDWDGDGDLDVYLANYERGLGLGTPDYIYINEGKSFRGIPLTPAVGRPLPGRGLAPCDFDLDGRVELYVANYRLAPNSLWDQGEDLGLRLGVAGDERWGYWGHSIGADWGDYDADGDFDLLVSNLAHPRFIDFSDKTKLYERTYLKPGAGTSAFADVARERGIPYDECHARAKFLDYDADGDLDIFITSVYENERSYLLVNLGGQFADVGCLAGARVFDGWGVAAGDYDRDGDLDLAVSSRGKVVLLVNQGHDNHWLGITGLPPGSVVEAPGPNGGVLVRHERGGEVFLGLGNRKGPLPVRVLLPGGTYEKTIINSLDKWVVWR